MKPDEEIRHLARTIANLMSCIIERDEQIAELEAQYEEAHSARFDLEVERDSLLAERNKERARIAELRDAQLYLAEKNGFLGAVRELWDRSEGKTK